MAKASQSIALVLMGSAALMISQPACERDSSSATTQPASGYSGHGYYRPGVYPGSRISHGPSVHSSSPRGGFGSSGHAVSA